MRCLCLSMLVFAAGSSLGTLFAADAPDATPFPVASSKKGLQVQMIDDALALGVQHAALNVDLTRLIDPAGSAAGPKWTSGGREFTFNPRTVTDLDRRVQPLSERGVVVYLILLPYASNDPARDTLMLHPGYAHGEKHTGPIGMFNVATPEGIAWLIATMEFLAHRYSTANPPQGRVWGYIVGNEVNSHWFWANQGHASLEAVIDNYERSVRIVHTAIRKASTEARVYLSLDHFWAVRYSAGKESQSISGLAFLREFARVARQRGDFDWHLAHHPYPEPLTDCRFWLDKKNAPQSPAAQVVTFRNLEVLLDFLATDALRFQGKPRRVILSEQGLHCSDRPNGEAEQAAAFALAYLKVSRLEGIDAFILHRHVDHAREGGLKLGLWTFKPGTISTPDRKRPIYEVFRAAGTATQTPAFEFALPLIGSSTWDEALENLKRD